MDLPKALHTVDILSHTLSCWGGLPECDSLPKRCRISSPIYFFGLPTRLAFYLYSAGLLHVFTTNKYLVDYCAGRRPSPAMCVFVCVCALYRKYQVSDEKLSSILEQWTASVKYMMAALSKTMVQPPGCLLKFLQ